MNGIFFYKSTYLDQNFNYINYILYTFETCSCINNSDYITVGSSYLFKVAVNIFHSVILVPIQFSTCASFSPARPFKINISEISLKRIVLNESSNNLRLWIRIKIWKPFKLPGKLILVKRSHILTTATFINNDILIKLSFVIKFTK